LNLRPPGYDEHICGVDIGADTGKVLCFIATGRRRTVGVVWRHMGGACLCKLVICYAI